MRGYLNGKPLEFEGSCDTTIASALPSGAIVMWANREIPDGWAICNGENGTPDLRDRFVLSSGSKNLGAVGGEETVTLTVTQMPRHNHTIAIQRSNTAGSEMAIEWSNRSSTSSASTRNEGDGEAHNNMPPYYVLYFIMKL